MKLFAAICLLVAASLPAFAKTKNDQQAYLESRLDDAARTCGQYLVANAKDPDSIKLDEKYSYSLGKVFTRNWIWITFPGWGRNSYGAVLRHNFTCEVRCKKDEPCSVLEVTE